MGQGVTHAGLAYAALQGGALSDWHVSCYLESTSSGSKAVRGVVVLGLALIRQGLPCPTSRILLCPRERSRFRPLGMRAPEPRPVSCARATIFSLHENVEEVSVTRVATAGVGCRLRPEWPPALFAATRCWLCRCRARPGGTRSCDRYRGSLRREPCCRP